MKCDKCGKKMHDVRFGKKTFRFYCSCGMIYIPPHAPGGAYFFLTLKMEILRQIKRPPYSSPC